MEYLLFVALFAIIVGMGVMNYRYQRKKGEEMAEQAKRFMQNK